MDFLRHYKPEYSFEKEVEINPTPEYSSSPDYSWQVASQQSLFPLDQVLRT